MLSFFLMENRGIEDLPSQLNGKFHYFFSFFQTVPNLFFYIYILLHLISFNISFIWLILFLLSNIFFILFNLSHFISFYYFIFMFISIFNLILFSFLSQLQRQHNTTTKQWLWKPHPKDPTTTPQKLNSSLQESQINIYWPQLIMMWPVTSGSAKTTTSTTTTKSTAFRSLRLAFIDHNYISCNQ